MIIVAGYKRIVKEGNEEIIAFIATEEVPCPICGEKLTLRGRCRRKLREPGGTVVYRLRVMKCERCRKTHRELAQWMVPYKRMSAQVLSGIAQSDNKNLGTAEGSTWHRVRKWVKKFICYALDVLRAVLVTDPGIKTVPTGLSHCEKLKYYVRLVVNSGRWISHRSAMTSGF